VLIQAKFGRREPLQAFARKISKLQRENPLSHARQKVFWRNRFWVRRAY
jgi:hypothetical protein